MSQINQFRFEGLIKSLSGNAGGAVGVDALSNINIVGDTTTVNVIGDPLTNTLTISATPSVAVSYLTDDLNSAIPALNVLTIAGGTNIGTTSAGSTVTVNLDDDITVTTVNAITFDTNDAVAGVTLSGTSLIADGTDADIDIIITPKGAGTVIIEELTLGIALAVSEGGTGASDLTDHGVLVGSGSATITPLAVGINGNVLVGSNGADPVFVAIGSTNGTIIPTGGPGTLVLEVADATTSQRGSVELATDVETIAGADSVRAIVPTSLKAKLGIQTNHGLIVGSGDTSALTSLGVAGNGQIPIGSVGSNPVIGNITSTGNSITITNGAGTLNIETGGVTDSFTGFDIWDGGAPYYDDTVLGSFTLSQSGSGYIKGIKIVWAQPQTIVGMTSGNTYYIYIDNTGTLQKANARTDELYIDNIVLFQCWRDNTAPINNQSTVKENHHYAFPVETSNYLHNTVGTVIENVNNGANITLSGTQKIVIAGDDQLDDHGLETEIPDSAGTPETFAKLYTDATGKWVKHSSSDTFTGNWNNAGVVTALTGGKYGVYALYVGKDTLNTTNPRFGAVLNTSQYNNLTAADTAISTGAISMATNELAAMENCRLGYIIYSNGISSIVRVYIDKNTLRSNSSTSGTNSASLVNTVVTNFDGILSAADTTVQSALDTIDDFGAATTDHAVIVGNGIGSALGAIAVGSTGETLMGTTAADPAWTNSPSFGGTVTATTVDSTNITTNVAAASLKMSGTTLEAIGTNANIDISITPKGAGTVIMGELMLTTPLSVGDGGTGAIEFIDHGLLLGSGTGAITPLAAATNGQIPIGSTGADCVLSTITAGTGITIINDPGSITLEAAGTLLLNNQVGIAYTLVIGDAAKLVTLTNAAAITLTVPTNASVAFAVGSQIMLYQGGAGTVTVAPAGGVTIRSADSLLNTYTQYSTVLLTKILVDTWSLSGDLN